jgi:hypothetical protein
MFPMIIKKKLQSWAVLIALSVTVPAFVHAEDLDGKRIYQRANCVGCHKWHGNGGGGYGGDALSLRHTDLTKEQIVETVRCGRPGTGMPFHLRGAYDTEPCYGMLRADLPGKIPPETTAFLRQPEIEAVAEYVISHIKGRGEPNYEECIAFFGGGHVCDIYKKPSNDAADPKAAPSAASQAKG